MTMRSKEFNDWMTAQYPRYKPSDDSVDVRVAWSVWQAATERAVRVCDGLYDAGDCVAAIRGTK